VPPPSSGYEFTWHPPPLSFSSTLLPDNYWTKHFSPGNFQGRVEDYGSPLRRSPGTTLRRTIPNMAESTFKKSLSNFHSFSSRRGSVWLETVCSLAELTHSICQLRINPAASYPFIWYLRDCHTGPLQSEVSGGLFPNWKRKQDKVELLRGPSSSIAATKVIYLRKCGNKDAFAENIYKRK